MSENPARLPPSDPASAEHISFLGAVITIVADGELTGDVLTLAEIDAPPGYENNLHSHQPSELFYVRSGTMAAYIEGSVQSLTAGGVAFVPGGTPHGFRVTGNDPLSMLAIFAPAGMAGFFRAVGTPVPDRTLPPYEGPPTGDVERMNELSGTYGVRRLGPLPRP